MAKEHIKEWQTILKQFDDSINVDGDFGPNTLKVSKKVAEKAGIIVVEPPKPPVTNKTPWIDIAKAEIGVKEKRGGENPRIIEYHSHTTLKATEDEVAWCSAFMCWCLEKVGYKSTKSAWARSYENYGKKLEKPKIGCIAVFDWQDGSGHVGFVSSFTEQTVTILGGNQSDSVCLTTFSRKNISAFRWPVQS
jgi:uncharacterized protein (TIGR02594 family)